jgi:hypothetical protein
MRGLMPVVLGLAVLAAGAADAAAKTPPPAKDKLVCTYQASTGSHIKRRLCMTESERKDRQRRDQERARQAQDRGFKTNVD